MPALAAFLAVIFVLVGAYNLNQALYDFTRTRRNFWVTVACVIGLVASLSWLDSLMN